MENRVINNFSFFEGVKELLDEGKSVTIRVKGNSMLPFIVNERDSVVLKKREEYKVGDIVLAKIYRWQRGSGGRNEEKYVLHRVKEILNPQSTTEKVVLLQGDGNIGLVEFATAENILGKVETIIFNGKEKSTASKYQRIKYWIWTHTIFARRYILYIYRRLPRLKTYTFKHRYNTNYENQKRV